MSLQDTAMIVNPTFKIWSGRKLDKDATKELCSDKNAVQGSARVNKSLMPDEPKLKAIRKLVGEARNYHYDHTLPWEDRGGGRILPTGLYVPYQKKMEDYKDRVVVLIKEFCEESYYDRAKTDGMQKLGQLANAWEYPARARVHHLFEATINYYPIPDPSDFRVQLGAHDIQRLKTKAREREKEIIKKSTETLWKRLNELAVHAEERLSDPDKSFHSTLTENIVHFKEIVGELNIGEDRFIQQVADDLAHSVDKDIDQLRKDVNVREGAANGAKTAVAKIQAQMEAFSNARGN